MLTGTGERDEDDRPNPSPAVASDCHRTFAPSSQSDEAELRGQAETHLRERLEPALGHEALLLEHGDVAEMSLEPACSVNGRRAGDRERRLDRTDAGVDRLDRGEQQLRPVLQRELVAIDGRRPSASSS